MNIKLVNLVEIVQNKSNSLCATSDKNEVSNKHCKNSICRECTLSIVNTCTVKARLTKAINDEY